MASGLVHVYTGLPTYLRLLLQDQGNVKLVYRENSVEESYQNRKDTKTSFTGEVSTDLTGTPLKIDLDDDDLGLTTLNIAESLFPNWTDEEARQIPLSSEEARNFMNKEIQELSLKKLNQDSKYIPYYCICNGADSRHVVVLGVQLTKNQFAPIRTLVHILPCVNANHEITTLSYMQKEHLKKDVRQHAQPKVCTFKSYNLFGQNLKHCTSVESSEHGGHISVDVFDNCKQKKVKMNLQVILGHHSSPLLDLWEDLGFINAFIKEINAGKVNANTLLNGHSNLPSTEINEMLFDAAKIISAPTKKTEFSLDLKNFRAFSVLDKLWNILRSCGTVGDLRGAFQFYFEELAKNEEDSTIEGKTAIGEIINGILKGKIGVPTLSFTQCFELLLELGLEKLKNDYLVIVTNFCQNTIENKWSDFGNDFLTNTNQDRRTSKRLSISPNDTIVDVKKIKQKFSFLNSLHTISEFFFLLNNNLKNYSLFEMIYKEFISKSSNVLANYEKTKLCEFSSEISLTIKDLENNEPVAFSAKLVSVVDSEEVTTVFFFSEFPIFPPCVFENYEFPGALEDGKFLYVTKLVRFA